MMFLCHTSDHWLKLRVAIVLQSLFRVSCVPTERNIYFLFHWCHTKNGYYLLAHAHQKLSRSSWRSQRRNENGRTEHERAGVGLYEKTKASLV